MRTIHFLLLAIVLLRSQGSFSQNSSQPIKLGSIIVHGSLRSRAELWDWFQGTEGDGSYAFSGNLLRISFSQQRDTLEWQFELGAPILLGLPQNAVAPGAQGLLGMGANYFVANDSARNTAMIYPKQAFVRFKNLFGSKAQSLKLGRFQFSDGAEVTPANSTLASLKRDRINQRLIGPFGFTHVERSFDGFHYVFNQPKTNVTLVGALPTRGVFQVDGWGVMRVGFLYASVTRSMVGKKNASEWRALGMYYDDWRHILKTDNRPLAIRRNDLANLRIGNFGGHYLYTAETSPGTFDLLIWGMLQTGKWGFQDHRAGAVSLEGGWQPKLLTSLRPWLRAGYFYGSGDGNPLDNTHNTFFQLLPTPRPFARFPFFDLINNRDIFGMLILRPHKAVTVRHEFHALRLAQRDDLWYLGGGAFQPWTSGYTGRPVNQYRSLANLYDISADYQINPSVSVTGYFGYAQGKAAPAGIYSLDRNGRYAYVEMNYKF